MRIAISFACLAFLVLVIATTWALEAIGWGRHDGIVFFLAFVAAIACGRVFYSAMNRLERWWQTWQKQPKANL